MDTSRCLTVLCFGLVAVIIQAQETDKGLIVSTLSNWVYSGRLNVYHGDPSKFRTNIVTGVTKMTIGRYSDIYSLAANTRDSSMLMLDHADNTIYSFDNFNFQSNRSSPRISKVHTGVSAATSQLAVDWLARNVYWTDGYYKYIAVHPLNFPSDTSLYKLLVTEQLSKPEGIAVDPLNRYLFWSDVNDKRSKLERSSLMGDGRTVIIKESDNTLRISSLALDIDLKTVYWCDIGRDTIQSSDYNGNNKRVLVRHLVSSFTAISMSKAVVCATDNADVAVLCFSKATGNITWFKSFSLQTPYALTTYDSDLQKVPPVTNPCDVKQCQHMCFHTDTSTATCGCKEGYKLQDDGISCQSEHGLLFGKAIILANSTNACMYDIHLATNSKLPPDCVLNNLTHLTYFVIDSNERMLYYVDSVASSINQVDMITGAKKVLFIESSIAAISGFSFDWTTQNLYWSDSVRGTVTVHSILSGATTELLSGLDNPKSITVSPHLEKMFWLTGSGLKSTLDSSNLDGTGVVTTLLPHGRIFHPEGLVYDDHSGKLYWNDEGDITSINPDGSGITYHVWAGKSATNILIYKGYCYWYSDDGTLKTSSLNSYYGGSTAADIAYMGTVKAMAVYDVDIQPMIKNNCSLDNGGCEHICEPTGERTMTCSCDFGYALQEDRHSCSSEPFEDSFALLPDLSHNRIYQLGLSDGEVRALDIPNVNFPVSVIYDKPTDNIYWTNILNSEIRASKLKSTKSDVIYTTWAVFPVGLAFDYSSGILYYTTEYYYFDSYIGCFHPHVGKHHTLINKDLDLPKNIALYPLKGLMFWTDISISKTRTSYIGTAHMDGRTDSIKKIVTTNILSPNGLVIDYSTDTIYWADAALSIIGCVDLNGNKRRTIISEQGAGLVGLDISPPYLYYIGRNKQRVTKFDLTSGPNGTKVEFMNDIHALGRRETIKVYPEQTQPVNVQCADKNGGCALFCFPIPAGRTCGCEDGESINADGKTCTGHISCNINIPNAILEQRCIGHAGSSCNFTCANGYKKTVDVLTCNPVGNWNNPLHTVCQSLTGTCSEMIPHGHVAPDCNREIGSSCSYVCSAGYTKASENDRITCLNTAAWSKPIEQLCTASTQKCPDNIGNAELDAKCNRAAGSVCGYICKDGYVPNFSLSKLVCLSDGEWNYNGQLCTNIQCKRSLQNGYFVNNCPFNEKSNCTYSCNVGFVKNSLVSSVFCMDSGNWNVDVDRLCTHNPVVCSKSMLNGKFTEPCSSVHGSNCDFKCNPGYFKQPIVQSVVCHNGEWSVDTNFLCIEQTATASYAKDQKQSSDGMSTGTVAGIVIVAILVTAAVVLAIVYFIWRRTKPQGKCVSDQPNLKFKRFDDANVQENTRAGGISNPIAGQMDIGNCNTFREDDYVSTDIQVPYDNLTQREGF